VIGDDPVVTPGKITSERGHVAAAEITDTEDDATSSQGKASKQYR
jgi:hypothetical protein